MPYALIRRGTKYLIMNKDTGKSFSNKPISKRKAESQLRILESLYSKEAK